MEREAQLILLRRPLLLPACALLLVALAGCQQDSQPTTAPTTTAAATTTTVAPTTTTKPPVTAAERAWVAGVAKLRRRLDKVFFQSEVVLTQAKVREYIRTGRSCAPGLARLGPPTERLRKAAATPPAPAAAMTAPPMSTSGPRRCWPLVPATSRTCCGPPPSMTATAATGSARPRLKLSWRWHDPLCPA
jgi:hypothetical protein